jgi:hypothetical protein
MISFELGQLNFMKTTTQGIETIIREYIEQKERSNFFGKKKLDAEKEYNKLLTAYDAGEKQYSLEHANKIYRAYHEMLQCGEESATAQQRFAESEEQLKEIGRILFEATITADIPMTPAINGNGAAMRNVRIAYNNGHVIVS